MLKAIHRMQRDERGFTLVELLIVIAIIAILAAIAIPQFSKYRTNAAKSACQSDLKNAINACAAEFANNASATSCSAYNLSISCNNGGSVTLSYDSANGTFSGTVTGNGAYTGTCSIVNNGVNCS